METTERRITGVDGISLFLRVWSPDKSSAEPEPKAVIQFLHGQGEYGGRYAHLAEFLTNQGYIIYVSDHRGHGRTVFEQPEDAREEHCIPGHMADKDGWQKCLDDQEIVRQLIRDEQPDLPLILAGHSLGSLMIQDMLIQDSHRWDLAVLMSSRGGRPDLNERALEIAVLFQFLIKGGRSPATWTDYLIMQSFAREIGEGENRSAWTSRDPEAIAAYDNDPMMNFTPSSRHWFDHAKFIKSRAQVSNIAKVRPDLPILLVAGSEDAMGKNGAAVRALEADYRATGKTDVTCTIYPEMRHELVNDIGKEQVFADMLAWLDDRVARLAGRS